jgi:RNA polymerase sigma-70 factor (ECF subfamily)
MTLAEAESVEGVRLPVLNGESDEVLAIRAREDRELFGVLYERHVRRIYNYAYYRTGSVADAEDLTARTFFQAMNNLHRYQVQGVPFSAWLFRIAHNLVANWHRDSGRHRAASTDGIIEVPSDEASPEDVAEASEERAELHRAVLRLAADRQQLLILKFSQQLTNDEIAAIMGRSEGAIKALLHRTVKGLRDELSRSKAEGRTKGAKK